LNFDHPEVREEFVKIANFWMDVGVDGFRLDAAKHIFDDFQSSHNDPTVREKNVDWWKEFRRGLVEQGHEPYLIVEIRDSSAAVIAPYLDQAFDSGFNFGLAEQLLRSVFNESNALPSTLDRIYELYGRVSGGSFVDAPFLSNHDQDRVMSRLGGNVDHAKMAASMLMTMAGNPFIYFGEEIGMTGMKPDERIREPMAWQAGDASLLDHYRRLIHYRNSETALNAGTIEPYTVADNGVMAYVRHSTEDQVLVVHNLTGEEKRIPLSGEGELYSDISFSSSHGAKFSAFELIIPAYTTVVLK